MRELNRLGVTGAIDAGGGFQNYPEDYAVIEKLADDGQLTIRLAYNLFTQKPKGEKDDFLRWAGSSKYQQGDDYFRHNGAGEMLVFSAADFEDFRQPRPDMPPEMEPELEGVVRILAQNRWPWRLHATYDETISRALDVFERVNQDMPLDGLHWFFDHAETISEQSIDRIAALGGGIAVQHRMAYQGEYFVERYGLGAAEATPPVARMLREGRQGLRRHRCDACRVLQSVGVARLAGHRAHGRGFAHLSAAQLPRPRDGAADVDRERHLVLQRRGQEGPDRGRPARRPDRAGPRLFRVRRERDRGHHLRVDDRRRQDRLCAPATSRASTTARRRRPCRTGRRCAASAATPPGAMQGREHIHRQQLDGAHGRTSACGVHGHDHGRAWAGTAPVDDLKSFWGALGCSCFAF